MVSKHKILDLIYVLIRDIESDWQPALDEINIWLDVQDLYFYSKIKEPHHANIILAYIVLAYDGNSKWLEPHKDRHDNQIKILTRLAGMSAMQNPFYNDLVFGFDKMILQMINWYVDYQKDWRWKDIVAADTYHSTALQMSMAGSIDPAIMKAIGQTRQLARADKKIAEQMRNEIRTEFLNLDTILEKEGKPKATEVIEKDFMNHESWVMSDSKNKLEIALELLRKKQAEQDEKDKKKEEAKQAKSGGLNIIKATHKKSKTGKPDSGNGDEDQD